MLQSEFMHSLVKTGQKTKAWSLKRGEPSIAPFIVIERGGEPISQVVVRQHQRDMILGVVSFCAAGFDADRMGVLFETYGSTHRRNPLTGRDWDAGDMDELASKHDGITKGWVHEALTILAVNRAGDVGMLQLPFRIVGIKQHLSWAHDGDPSKWETLGEADAVTGMMPRALRDCMLAPSGSQLVSPDFPLDRDERDIATAQALTRRGHGVMLLTASDDMQRQLKLTQIGKIIDFG